MTNCTDKITKLMHPDHKFFEVKKLSEYVPGSPSYRAAREGVLVVCANCGEVREAWETGEVIIRPEQPVPKAYDPNSTAGTAKN